VSCACRFFLAPWRAHQGSMVVTQFAASCPLLHSPTSAHAGCVSEPYVWCLCFVCVCWCPTRRCSCDWRPDAPPPPALLAPSRLHRGSTAWTPCQVLPSRTRCCCYPRVAPARAALRRLGSRSSEHERRSSCPTQRCERSNRKGRAHTAASRSLVFLYVCLHTQFGAPFALCPAACTAHGRRCVVSHRCARVYAGALHNMAPEAFSSCPCSGGKRRRWRRRGVVPATGHLPRCPDFPPGQLFRSPFASRRNRTPRRR
jgi:hypothetical protein